ncbi:Uu.00g138390.m01.CDS01 [Anthostomella pinea]|uniref:Inheritance of peroxisomes protein 1 n=1 Tax=Anthostomella pinea TaxID=933095 RepID=A0AAI8VPP3_9PEZI|nr:Uu.00g138390.m01.CDS01 [Anthostomella pinea]
MSRPRRVATAPVSSQPLLSRSNLNFSTSSRSEDLVETLYSHPSVKIIAFSSSQRSSLSSWPPSSETDDRPGSLPASSRLERTIAVGPFRIYRAPGSVAFLSCGSALQPILPKSQCWCIDEANSQFVLQIRRPQYWRIELPVAEPDQAPRALQLRDVFGKILLFEKTACPFQRSFTVPLPLPPTEPVKKKAWTPMGKNLITAPFQSDLYPSSPSPRATNKERRMTVATSETPATKAGSPPRNEVLRQPKEVALPPYGKTTPPSIVRIEGNEGSTEALQNPAIAVLHTALPDQRRSDISKESPVVSADSSTAVELSQGPRNVGVDRVPQKTESPGGSSNSTVSTQLPKEVQTRTSASESSYGINKSGSGSVESRQDASTASSMVPESSRKEEVVDKASHSPSANTRASTSHTTDMDSFHTTDMGLQATTSIGDEQSCSSDAIGRRDTPPEEVLVPEDDGPSSFEGSGHVVPVNLAKKRVTRMLAGRSFTAPPQLTLVTSPPSKKIRGKASVEASLPEPPEPPEPLEPLEPLESSEGSRAGSPVGSTDSFHSVQSWHSPITPLPPSPPSSRPVTPSLGKFPFPHQDIPRTLPHARDVSDYTVTPSTEKTLMPSSAGATDHSDRSMSPRSPTDTNDLPTAPASVGGKLTVPRSSALEERPQARQRPRPNNLSISRRALSPLPPAANLFSPQARQSPQGRLAAVRRLPSAIAHKTIEILLSPPSHLVNLMLKVAAKIAAGEWRGLVFGLGEGGEQIPVQWDYSDGEYSSFDDDDDYTMAKLGQGTRRSTSGDIAPTGESNRRTTRELNDSRSWEVD